LHKKRGLLAERIHRRINKFNKNLCFVFVGETGSGKSWSALALAESVDPTFNVDRVIFTPLEFMKLLRSGTLEQGMAIIFDEAGVCYGARDWYKNINKSMNMAVQSFRQQNLLTIFTIPDISMIDSQARNLMHMAADTLYIDFQKKQCVCKVYHLVKRLKYKEPHTRWPVVILPSGKRADITTMRFDRPSLALRRRYDEKKRAFLEEMYDKRIGELEADDLKKEAKSQTHAVQVTCPRCNRTWMYTGSMSIAKCSNCGKRVPVVSSKPTS